MNCRQARAAMRDALDGGCEVTPEVGAHLAECRDCRAEYNGLAALGAVVAVATACEPPAGAVERAFTRAQGRAALRRGPSVAGRLAWVSLAAAAFVLGFGLRGLIVPGPELSKQAPEVREKIVRVEVPVTRERVVERVVRVPVVRTRVATRYVSRRGVRDRAAEPPSIAAMEQERPQVIVEKVPALTQPRIQYSESTRLATLAGQEPQR